MGRMGRICTRKQFNEGWPNFPTLRRHCHKGLQGCLQECAPYPPMWLLSASTSMIKSSLRVLSCMRQQKPCGGEVGVAREAAWDGLGA